MSFTYITAAGEVISDGNGAGPYQHTPEGLNSGLPVASTPFSQWDGSGGSYTALYETQPWVFANVNGLVRQVARLPLKVYERDSQNVKKPVSSGRLYDALQRPADRHGPVHLKTWLAFPPMLHGNGTIKKIRPRAGEPPIGFYPLDWRSMEAHEIEQGSQRIDYWRSTQFKKPSILFPDEVVHIAWWGTKGPIGVSPLKALGVTLRQERAAQRWQESIFRNAARPSGGVTLPEAVAGDAELRRELKQDLAQLHQGAGNAGRPVVLPPGSKWEGFSHSAHDAELIEQRKLTREEIAAAYNMPQPLVGILDHATYSNVAEMHRMLYTTVLGPWLVLIEETFKAQAIDGEPAFEGQWVEFDLAEVLRGDTLKEAIALRNQVQTGILTINEARQIKNLPKIDHPDCDRPLIPTNNVQPVGRPARGADGSDIGALASNLQRTGERLYRKARAGDDGWDPGRFRRELHADLEAAGADDPERTAVAWTNAIGSIAADALNDPDLLRAAFAALPTETGAEQQ